MTRKIQALYPDRKYISCPYCDGRGFVLVEQFDNRNPDKQIGPLHAEECKFCAGLGQRDASKPN